MVTKAAILPSIGPRQWKHVYILLGLIVVADRRVVPEELKAFIEGAISLAKKVDPSLVVTKRMAKDWFVLNRDTLLSIVDGLEYDSVIIDTLSCLKPFREKRDVVKTMIEIAHSERNYSLARQMFIKKTMLYCNIPVEEEADLLRAIGLS